MNILHPPKMLERGWLISLQICWVLAMGVWLILRTVVLQPVAYVLSLPFRPVGTLLNLVTHWAGDDPSRRWGYIFVGSLGISMLTLYPFVGNRTEVVVFYFVSLLVHELFHGFGYYIAGIPFYILFIGPVGGAAVALDVLYNKMKHWDKSIMLLLGPVGSYLVAIVCWALARLFPENASFFMMFGGFNMTLVLFNMIALGGLDGGRIYLTMMASLREDREKFVALAMSIVTVIVLVSAFLQSFRFELIILFLVWMLVGYVKTIGKDDPRDYLREPAMKTKGVIMILCLYLGLFTASAFMYSAFPDWSPLVVIHPSIASHLPEIGMFLAIVGLYVLATDLSLWKRVHVKYQTRVEILALILILGVSQVPVVWLAVRGIPAVNIWIVYVVATVVGQLTMRGMFLWNKIHDAILSEMPKEPVLDIFEVVGDTA